MRRPLPPCIDGVRDLKEIDATHFDAVLETRVAYMRFNFKVAVEMTKISPPDSIYAKVEGTPMGMVGRLTATATTQLSEADGRTLILSLSETQSSWQMKAIPAMLMVDERCLQPDLVGGGRIVPVASGAASRDPDASPSA
jgi:carbon monoxide dehydrogenase subunit G